MLKLTKLARFDGIACELLAFYIRIFFSVFKHIFVFTNVNYICIFSE